MRLIDSVRPGSRVTILTPHGQRLSGRAVMPSVCGGWVLNGGGRHGTPLLADDDNTVAVSGGRQPYQPSVLSAVERLQLAA